MCGIAAFIGDCQHFDSSRFAKMAELSSRRGRDSSGLGIIQDGAVTVVHEIGAGRRARRRLFARMTLPAQGRFGVVFHSRLATDGRIGSPLESQPLLRNNDLVAFNGLIDWQDPACDALRPSDAPNGANDTLKLLHALTATPIEKLQELISEIPYEMNFLWASASTLYAFTNVGSLYRAELNGARLIASESGIIESVFGDVESEPLPKGQLIVIGEF